MPILSVITLFVVASLHGFARYGLKNLVVLFLLTWVISLFFEALSIQTGFPFGEYTYVKLIGPRLFEVPLIIMFAYFSMIYVSWMIAHILVQNFGQKLKGSGIVLVPLIATFVMVMWDLCIDPLASTLGSLWVWKERGVYFGVPLQNYFGWFLVVYLILQGFALYISRFDTSNKTYFSEREFWVEVCILYGVRGLFQILSPFTVSQHYEIYGPMALITIFTMMFVTFLSLITIRNVKSRI